MIYAFIGPSGSGKTTLMREWKARHPHLHFIRSVTTRKPRGTQDDNDFYEFVDESVFKYLDETGQLAQSVEYAGNYYGTRYHELTHDGMYAVTEDGVRQLRRLHYPVVAIRVVPGEYRVTDDVARRMADALRSQSELDVDFTVHNSHEPGGLERALDELSGLLDKP